LIICTKDIKTTCSSKMLADFAPPYDATVMEKLNAQGIVVLGKTSMDEFAMGGSSQTSALSKPKNPFNTSCVPGGSSGGSATAVSAGLCAAALGTDTGGSIRQPAAFCGITGMKPTYGTVSRFGLVAFGSSLDQIGPMTNSAKDCGIILNAIAGQDIHDRTTRKHSIDFNSLLGDDIKGKKIRHL
jgi:aspartyl-tRNA(Asn)/glutamyl-tRNA(Gln) amidotransferase subunit A